ncbi:hypothetical protein BWD09_09870 [Neisseria dentiae]|uniref:Zinc-binding dehydrogenase n=1 Tax=Neisseria dentiae TaxID=194197 RepID=A0A1X3D4V6_9NEIS|nr:hypothetical protein [Neisseria dentiae]OSI14734.1 hypothetical protein BWD09_09870 [Neisseria dentiae]QMT44151.1 hypothetical protein H3L92_07295 [Neisseria dentiae]
MRCNGSRSVPVRTSGRCALLASGGSRPCPLGTINAANLRQAHALLESGQTIGKITLSGF